ncbi:MAG: 1-deoxy-D-xylulose-5-phosphate reductoisomerase [Flavobacteriales bacterium]|jgi:1-deoxy-D-xylulose-5-phosphate reductoisomerase|nr:1-deoxy-D-xylulose-5-phosphate reductoisomerase [Flavobacteriales bacterium]MDG1348635.1 1-deoxy-D-xylulose-5-phosphate reductoisomerase [Flavobacteriales bacterium]
MEKKRKQVAILGSTGSIGTQALEVISEHSDLFEVEVLTANNNSALLIEQAKKFKPNTVVITNEDKYKEVDDALFSLGIKVFAGQQSLEEVVEGENIDVVLTALMGYSGLKPTIRAIKAKKNIALANKETLVVAGDLITKLCQEYGVNIYPVDSEHSAIFQCLVGEQYNPIEKIYLTASGGPFRGRLRNDLLEITKAEALKHPNWEMGAKITIDSASMMNKGLEVIEAKWLFDLKAEQIDVVVHPQSIIHSAVQFEDGSIKAQLGVPDMKLPIQYALGFPKRLPNTFKRFSFMDYPNLTFEKPDLETFRNLQLAYDCMEKGGNMPCILNAANEIAVAAFLQDKIGFLNMSDLIANCMEKITFVSKPTLTDYVATDEATRILANELL